MCYHSVSTEAQAPTQPRPQTPPESLPQGPEGLKSIVEIRSGSRSKTTPLIDVCGQKLDLGWDQTPKDIHFVTVLGHGLTWEPNTQTMGLQKQSKIDGQVHGQNHSFPMLQTAPQATLA